MKPRTTAQTIRIPNDTYADIKREAEKKGTTFSREANERLRHGENSLTPAILVSIQNIINKVFEGVETHSSEPIEEAQKEVNKLWAYRLSK